MSPDDSDEYDDPIRLIDFEQRRVQAIGIPVTEFDAADSDGEVLIEKNINVPQPRKKVTVSLPVTFFDIPRNIKLLRKCQPLAIKAVKCDKYPWYHRKYLKKSSAAIDVSKSKDSKAIEPKISSEVCEQDMTKVRIRPVDTPYPVLKTAVAKQNCIIIGKQSNCKKTVQCVNENKNNTPLIPKNPPIDFKKNQGLVGLKLTKLTGNAQSVEFGIVLNESNTQSSECNNIVNACTEDLKTEDKYKQNTDERKEDNSEDKTEKEVINENVNIAKDNEGEKKNTELEEITKKLNEESLKIKVITNENFKPKVNINDCPAKASSPNLEQKQKDAFLIGTKIKPNPNKGLPEKKMLLKQIHPFENKELRPEVAPEKVQSNHIHVENKAPCSNDKQCNVNNLYIGQVIKHLTTDKNSQKTRRRKVKPESIYNNKNALKMILFKPEKNSSKFKNSNNKLNEPNKNQKSKKKDHSETDRNKDVVKPVMEDTTIINSNVNPVSTVSALPKQNEVNENKVVTGHPKLNFGALHLQKCTPVKLTDQKENAETIKVKSYSNANSAKKTDPANTIQKSKNPDMPDLSTFGTDTSLQNILDFVIEHQMPTLKSSKANPAIPSQKDNAKSNQDPVTPPVMGSNPWKTRIGHIEHVKVHKKSLINQKTTLSSTQNNTQSLGRKTSAVHSQNVPSNQDLFTGEYPKQIMSPVIDSLSDPLFSKPPPPPPALPAPPPPPPPLPPHAPPPPPSPYTSLPNQNTPVNRQGLPQPLMATSQSLPLPPTSLYPPQMNTSRGCPPERVPQVSPTQINLQQENSPWNRQGRPMPIQIPSYLSSSQSNYKSGPRPTLLNQNMAEMPQPYVTVSVPASYLASSGNRESKYGAQMQRYTFTNNNQTIHMQTMQLQQNNNCAPRIIHDKSTEGMNAIIKPPPEYNLQESFHINHNANMKPNNLFKQEHFPSPNNMPLNQNMIQNRIPTMNCNIRQQGVQNQQYPVYNIPTLNNRTSGQANIIPQQNFRPMTPQQPRCPLNNNMLTPNAGPCGCCYFCEPVSGGPPTPSNNVWAYKMPWDSLNPAPTHVPPPEPNYPLPTPSLNQNNSITSKSVAGTTIIGENISGPVRKININAGAINANKTDPLIEMNEITPVNSKKEMLEELCRATNAVSPTQSPRIHRHIPVGLCNPPISRPPHSDWKIMPPRSNSPKNSGYSPPILPIPTFQSTYEQLNNTPMKALNFNKDITESVNEKQTTEMSMKRKIEDDDTSLKHGKKISLDEYKKRVSHNDGVPETVTTEEEFMKKEIKSENTELDLGYDSDATTKL